MTENSQPLALTPVGAALVELEAVNREFDRLDDRMKAALRAAKWNGRRGRARLGSLTTAVRNRFENRGLVDRSFWLTARGERVRQLVLAEPRTAVAE